MKYITSLILLLIVPLLSFSADEYQFIVKEKPLLAAKNINSGLQPESFDAAKTIFIKADGKSLEEVEASLKKSGNFTLVEPVIEIKVIMPESTQYLSEPIKTLDRSSLNDPFFQYQDYWFQNEPQRNIYGRSNIINTPLLAATTSKIRVGVVDGPFDRHEDLSYKEGYRFIEDDDKLIGPDYLSDCTSDLSHGTNVAGVIAATANNGVGMAGIIDADIVAATAITCKGSGSSIAMLESILWLSGAKIEGIPIISEPVDIINLSIGGGSLGCGTYSQSVIDYASSKGIVIVVAAGNNNIDVQNGYPSSCNNIIVAGASNKRGHKTSFSNFGKKIDLMAEGDNVVATHKENEYLSVAGTSFSAPIIAATIAMAKYQRADLGIESIRPLLKFTASNISPTEPSDSNESCANERCGAGILDAATFVEELSRLSYSQDVSIRHVLAEDEYCDDHLLFSDSNAQVSDLCSLNEVVFSEIHNLSEDHLYSLYRVPIGLDLTLSNATKLIETKESSAIVEKIDTDRYVYGFMSCFDGSCKNIAKINNINIEPPLSCNLTSRL